MLMKGAGLRPTPHRNNGSQRLVEQDFGLVRNEQFSYEHKTVQHPLPSRDQGAVLPALITWNLTLQWN
jgi:hypothetical protein